MQKQSIGIIGAGVVGLASALFLQRAGYRVTVMDRQAPGMGASFGSAGLFADYACLPFARASLLRKMPAMLWDRESPLSVQWRYLPQLLPYGWHYVKACAPHRYRHGREALSRLQQQARVADKALFQLTTAQSLIKQQGCLGLFSDAESFAMAKQGELAERQACGVSLSFLNPAEVAALEPDLADFHAGGVFYPDTQFTVSPHALCQHYADYFAAQGGTIVCDEIKRLVPKGDHVRCVLSEAEQTFDHLVIAAGVSSYQLLQPLGIKIPLVSERGYHVMLSAGEQQLNRPVGWLDKAVFLTPMQTGLRLAGMAEFADETAAANAQHHRRMLRDAQQMIRAPLELLSEWVGSRPSTPDSLPVIGRLPHFHNMTVAFGHGHLGLTLSAITGQLVTQIVRGDTTDVAMAPFAADRFSR